MTKEIYISADKVDNSHEERLRNGLKPILSHFDLTLWGRRDIDPGLGWKDEMHEHLSISSYFVPLVSADYLASNMCQIEVQAGGYRALHEGLKIISIIVRPCAFEFSSLAQFPYLPKDGKSITEYSNADRAWLGVLRDLIEMMSKSQKYLS